MADARAAPCGRSYRHRVATALTWTCAAAAAAALGWVLAHARLPGDHTGYSPVQPIAFSHRLHTTELQVSCRYCHAGAVTDRHAGMPAAQTCMNCHRFVLAPSQALKDEQWRAAREGRPVRRVVSDEMRKLLRAQGLGDMLNRDTRLTPAPIRWVRTTQFPDFAFMHHGAHARVGIACQQCHGPVETFERTRQAQSLSMGSCIDCHRTSNRDGVGGQSVDAALDCVACHR